VLDLKKELLLRTLPPKWVSLYACKDSWHKKIAKASMQKEEVILCTNAKSFNAKRGGNTLHKCKKL
jgi:hypothetical protein